MEAKARDETRRSSRRGTGSPQLPRAIAAGEGSSMRTEPETRVVVRGANAGPDQPSGDMAGKVWRPHSAGTRAARPWLAVSDHEHRSTCPQTVFLGCLVRLQLPVFVAGEWGAANTSRIILGCISGARRKQRGDDRFILPSKGSSFRGSGGQRAIAPRACGCMVYEMAAQVVTAATVRATSRGGLRDGTARP